MFGRRYEWPFPITANRLHTVLSDFFSSPVNNTTAATYTLSQAKDASKVLTVDKAAGCAVTLPASQGNGDVYDVVITTAITSNTSTIKTAGTDTMVGWVSIADTTGGNGFQQAAGSTHNTITMNGGTTGGLIGSKVRLRDVKKGKWLVEGFLVGSGSLAASISAT